MFKGEFKIPPGADVNALDGTFRSPVCYALMHNRIDAFRTLLAAGAVVDATAMGYAARYSNTEMMKCLLTEVPSLLREYYSTPPLLIAVQHLNTNAVLPLLDARVDPNRYPQHEISPLLYSAKANCSVLASILVEAGAKDDYVLSYAITKKRDLDFIESLIPATSPAALNRSTFFAIQNNAGVAAVKLLLSARASPDGDKFVCPLTAAVSKGVNYTELLLQHGAYPFIRAGEADSDALRLLKTAQLSILEENLRAELACFIACYRPVRYTVDKGDIPARYVHPLAHLTWAYGVRPIRVRIVAYLVPKKRRKALLSTLREGF